MGKRWKRRDLRFGREKKRINYDLIRNVGIWIFQLLIVCVFAFVFVWYFGQRITNNGDSMNPVLQSGDATLVNRIVYDMSKPKRGDIIAFKPNGNENAYFYIKRIIGLPGETVQIEDGKIYIDGEVLEEAYETIEITDPGIAAEPITLGGDEYFVLGDNRESSEDSRLADIGNVKKSEIEGKTWFILSPRQHFGFVN